MAQASETEAVRTREVRLGLVMYGGVSLATYIYGVAQELYRTVRGQGVYRLIKALTDSDVVVDVISGTSAGGINGILLAYCLANRLDFASVSSTWRKYGALGELLREPNDLDAVSLLKGDAFFLKRLEEAFRDLWRVQLADKRPAGRDGVEAPLERWESELCELDLFITSTDTGGRINTELDAAGHAIDVKDHRVVFKLKHRKDRKLPFDPRRYGADVLPRALAKLARSTSSFPVAFEPVCLLRSPAKGDEAVDECLRRWADLPPERDVFLADGGILDNKPFTQTIREIFFRLADRKVDRKLFYVEPDPEQFAGAAPHRRPNLFTLAFDSLSSIPAYESIADDLRALREHNERVAHLGRLTTCYQDCGITQCDIDPKSYAFVERWWSWEEQADSAPQPAPAGQDDGGGLSSYSRSRLVAFTDRILEGLLRPEHLPRAEGALSPAEPNEERLRKYVAAAAKLVRAFDDLPGSGDLTLYAFDVSFRLRRMFHLLYACPFPAVEQSEGEMQRLRGIRHALNRQTKLLEVIRAAIERLVDEVSFAWYRDGDEAMDDERAHRRAAEIMRGDVASALLYLLNGKATADVLPAGYETAWADGQPPQPWLDRNQLNEVNCAFQRRIDDIKTALKGKRSVGEVIFPELLKEPYRSVLAATDACERRMLKVLGGQQSQHVSNGKLLWRTLAQEYRDFALMDAKLFPLRALSGVEEQDAIETVRISPKDAQRGFSHKAFEEKLAGDALGHFGGFLKRSWRANDILWGRLDGSCQLIETLFTRERVAEVAASPILRCQFLAPELDPQILFPKSPAATQLKLRQWLADLASNEGLTRGAALAPQRFDEMRDLLIEATQLETLHAEIREVLDDAITEQAESNQFRVPATCDGRASGPQQSLDIDPATTTFISGGTAVVDGLVRMVAADRLTHLAFERAQAGPKNTSEVQGDCPAQTPFGQFFSTKYRVGLESVSGDVPAAVILMNVSRAMLVLRNCIAGAFGARQEEIRSSLAYRITGVFLWAFYGAAVLMQRGWRPLLGALGGLTLVSAMFLAMAAYWTDPLLRTNGLWSGSRLLTFVAVPLAIIVLELVALAIFARRRWPRRTHTLPLHPFSAIPERWQPSLAKALSVAALLSLIVTMSLASDRGWVSTDQLTYAADSVRSWDGARKQNLIAVLQWDTVFAVAYTALLTLLAVAVARALRTLDAPGRGVFTAIAWLAIACGALDLFENLSLLALCKDSLRWPIELAQVAADNKWFPPLIVAAATVVGALWAMWQMSSLRQRA